MVAVLLAIVVLIFPSMCVGQDASRETMRRPRDLLRERGIDLSIPSLIASLHNPNAEIRSLAALQLADDHAPDAKSLIEVALGQETAPRARIGMATALISLKDNAGMIALQKMCSDPAVSTRHVIEAAQVLTMSRSSIEPCFGVLLDDAAHAKTEDRGALASLLADLYKEAPPVTAQRSLEILETWVEDKKQEPSVRLAAADALARIGSRSAIPVIRTAIEAESDQTLLSSFRHALHVLEKSQ